ncbi:MAG: LysM peptidoglycan-binding domain-containing protein, partial [Dehalococcoidia bacterium]
MLSFSLPCFALLGVAVLVAGCGGGDEGDGEPAAAPPAEVVTEPSAEEPAAAGLEVEVGRILAAAPLPLPTVTSYVVAPGDTLGSIASAFGTTVAAIVDLNGIANPDAIFVGQVFRIARSPAPTLLPQAPVSTDLEAVDLVNVIDGDTIEVRLADGSTVQVRYLGIEAPETDPDQGGAAPWGPEATAKNADLLSGGRVYVEADISDRDESGRWLRYVWVEGADGS